jgi:DNA-directed RNA polymerase subunit H (RpoH/RPB5)
MPPHQSSGHLQQIFKSRSVILSLLASQGYEVDDYTQFTMTEVSTLVLNKQLDMLVENPSTGAKTYVKYHISKNIRPANIKEYAEDLFTLEQLLGPDDGLVIVVNDDPNDTLTRTIKNLWETNRQYVSLYSIAALQFNILEHEKVPEHTRLTEQEKADIYLTYRIKDDSQVPEISRLDPVALAICLRPGELCKIIRPSKTAVTAPYYRLCIN